MGGATALLAANRPRALLLGALAAALVGYGALAQSLWELPSRADLAVVALVVLPAFLAVVALALPVTRGRRPVLLVAGAVAAAALWVALDLLGADSLANVAKFAFFVLAGVWFVTLFEELWWVALVAVLVPWVDVWSVAAGPTSYVIEERPGIFERVSVSFAIPGERGSVNLGPPDVIFFALFLAAADRFRLRVAWTWVAMTAFLALTLVVVWEWEIAGLPALPAVCLGFLAANADLLWDDARRAWRLRHEPPELG